MLSRVYEVLGRIAGRKLDELAETIRAEVEELARRVREVDEMTPEREKNLIPWEEVKARLMDQLAK